MSIKSINYIVIRFLKIKKILELYIIMLYGEILMMIYQCNLVDEIRAPI